MEGGSRGGAWRRKLEQRELKQHAVQLPLHGDLLLPAVAPLLLRPVVFLHESAAFVLVLLGERGASSGEEHAGDGLAPQRAESLYGAFNARASLRKFLFPGAQIIHLVGQLVLALDEEGMSRELALLLAPALLVRRLVVPCVFVGRAMDLKLTTTRLLRLLIDSNM